MSDTSPRTTAVQSGLGNDPALSAVVPPLYISSTYGWETFGEAPAYDYGRGGNHNRALLGEALAKLEGGAGGVVTASGMAAIDLVTNTVSAEQTIVAPHDCYGGTWRLLDSRARQGRYRVRFVDQTDDDALADALEGAALVLVETPSNPLMRLVDIEAVCARSHEAGAKVMADNTFLSPARQRPLKLGADFVVHSTTKFLNGHSDVVGGAVVARDAGDAEQMEWWANNTGVTGAPFDSWLTLRGLRTLFVRMDAAEANAIALVERLQGHEAVERVHFPGLGDDAVLMGHQQSGPGAMLSFELRGGREAARAVCEAVGVFRFAESLGGTESLICHPATMTHRGMSAEARAEAGVGDSLLRISAGIEGMSDLVDDLEQALVRAT